MKNKSYLITFFPLGIAAIFMSVDMFTDYVITEQMINLLVLMIPSTVAGGLIKKGFTVFESIKKPKVES